MYTMLKKLGSIHHSYLIRVYNNKAENEDVLIHNVKVKGKLCVVFTNLLLKSDLIRR